MRRLEFESSDSFSSAIIPAESVGIEIVISKSFLHLEFRKPEGEVTVA